MRYVVYCVIIFFPGLYHSTILLFVIYGSFLFLLQISLLPVETLLSTHPYSGERNRLRMALRTKHLSPFLSLPRHVRKRNLLNFSEIASGGKKILPITMLGLRKLRQKQRLKPSQLYSMFFQALIKEHLAFLSQLPCVVAKGLLMETMWWRNRNQLEPHLVASRDCLRMPVLVRGTRRWALQ